MEIAGWPSTTRVYNNNDVLHMVASQSKLDFDPGTDYEYSNSNYVLLVIILERVTGQPISEFDRTHIFEPLGMTSTSWRTNFQDVQKNLAKSYIETDQGFTERLPFEDVHGDAGIITNVSDLLKWTDALAKRKFGQYVGEMMETRVHVDGRVLDRGHGLGVNQDRPAFELAHGGSVGAYRAWIAWYPTQHLSVALTCNNGGRLGVGIGRGGQFGHAIADPLLPPAPRPAGTTGGGSASQTGVFAAEKTGMPVTVALDSTKSLVVDGSLFRHLAKDRFESAGAKIEFEPGDDAFTLLGNDGAIDRYVRVQPIAAANPTVIAGLTGRYYSPDVNVAYDVERSGDGLRMRLTTMPFLQIDLYPAYKGVWRYDNRFGKGAGVIRFEKAVSGVAPSFTDGWKNGSQAIKFTRVPTRLDSHLSDGSAPKTEDAH
jgi:hypothetical protein